MKEKTRQEETGPNDGCIEKISGIYFLAPGERPMIAESDLGEAIRDMHLDKNTERRIAPIMVGNDQLYLSKRELCGDCPYSGLQVDELLLEKICGSEEVFKAYAAKKSEVLAQMAFTDTNDIN